MNNSGKKYGGSRRARRAEPSASLAERIAGA
jgi:hypothetical protein